jgi:AraC-like DNA-binding protein
MTTLLYEEIIPEKSLSPFIKRFWKFYNPAANKKRHTILPDGYFDLVIKITNTKINNISLFGLCTKELEIVIPANTIVIGICCKPLAAEYIVKQNIKEVINGNKDLPNNFWDIINIPFTDFQIWTEQITNRILSELENAKQIDERKQNMFTLLFQSNGSSTIQELSNKVFWNSRQMNRYFNDRFGLSLKAYCNILRCFACYTQIREGDLFPNNNFYDQSHFIKEIKKHTGVNPKQLHQNKNDRFLQFKTLTRQ